MIQQVFRFVSALVSLYMVVILIRIVLTWFRGMHTGRAEEFLASVTDPYLNWFRRNVPVRLGALDFSPVVGILFLGLVNTVANQLAFSGTITFSFILAIVRIRDLVGRVVFFDALPDRCGDPLRRHADQHGSGWPLLARFGADRQPGAPVDGASLSPRAIHQLSGFFDDFHRGSDRYPDHRTRRYQFSRRARSANTVLRRWR